MLNQQTALDLTFQALADPSRRAMIERLSRGPSSVSDLAKPLSISLPAALQHLALLEGCGLVASEKVGRVRTCRIQPKALTPVESWLRTQRAEWMARLDRLDDYLNALQSQGGDHEPD